MSIPEPVYCRSHAFASFASAVQELDHPGGLFRAAFAISLHDKPNANLEQVERTIADLADTVRHRVHSTNPEARLAHLHDVLFDVVGLRGNVEDYYHPDNSYLPEVLRTHRGIPISLVLVYKSVAEQVGLAVHGINAPGHFLAGIEFSQQRLMYVDPFYGGDLLKLEEVYRRIEEATGQSIDPTPETLALATPGQWLSRMLNNLQATFARLGRERDLYAMQELQQLLRCLADQ